MKNVDRAAAIRGKTLRFVCEAGTAGEQYGRQAEGEAAAQQLVGFASSAKEWHPVRGTFQVVR